MRFAFLIPPMMLLAACGSNQDATDQGAQQTAAQTDGPPWTAFQDQGALFVKAGRSTGLVMDSAVTLLGAPVAVTLGGLGLMLLMLGGFSPLMAPQAMVMKRKGKSPPAQTGPLPATNCVSAGMRSGGAMMTMPMASAAIAPISLGHYVGEADLDVGGKLERCYAPEALARLRALQRKYDPRGMFKRRIAAAPMLRMVG